jgi:hypothetical protein
MNMEKSRNTILIASLVLVGLTIPVGAETATMNEAQAVSKNWIDLIVQKTGSWGDANTAYVEAVQEFKRGSRTLGYFCRVKPIGYIVLSLHKQLAPVKAYSATCDLDPESEVGMAKLLKDCMERILNWINESSTRMNASPDDVMADILEINYRDSWDRLNVDAMSFQQKLDSEIEPLNYQSGQVLLTSSWHQGDPYNQTCPPPPSGDDCTAAHCLVGCVATAGAQIMRYWNWPPYGVGSGYNDSYDWVNMPDRATGASTTAQKDAVAELCREVGRAVDMDYCAWTGCESPSSTSDMEGVFEDQYRYSTDCVLLFRGHWTATNWFALIQAQLNANRPMQYVVLSHSIVCDGWRIIGTDRQYHMNYGWDDSANTWYTLDGLFYPDANGTTNDEYVLANIYPAQSLHSFISGTYARNSFFHRYFNVDAWSPSATFDPGQYLQFLPGITVTCISTTGGSTRFNSSAALPTRLFSRGDITRGVRLHDFGAIKLNRYGSIRLE